MRVYELSDPGGLRLRAHPWVHSDEDPTARYVDFRRNPALIRSSLEDFVPWAGHAFAETFFGLIEWLSGPQSALESNDCAFSGVGPNESGLSELPLEASGRLMVLQRDLLSNTSPQAVRGLAERIARGLAVASPDLEQGVVGVTVVDVQYVTLPPPRAAQMGQQLMLSFWAWGTDEAETTRTLNEVLVNLSAALRDEARD